MASSCPTGGMVSNGGEALDASKMTIGVNLFMLLPCWWQATPRRTAAHQRTAACWSTTAHQSIAIPLTASYSTVASCLDGGKQSIGRCCSSTARSQTSSSLLTHGCTLAHCYPIDIKLSSGGKVLKGSMVPNGAEVPDGSMVPNNGKCLAVAR